MRPVVIGTSCYLPALVIEGGLLSARVGVEASKSAIEGTRVASGACDCFTGRLVKSTAVHSCCVCNLWSRQEEFVFIACWEAGCLVGVR